MTGRGTALLALLSMAAACHGLEIALDAPSARSSGAAGSGAGDGGATGESRGGTAGSMVTAGVAAAGGLPPLVCSADNWTSDEVICNENGGPPPACKGTEVDWQGCRGTGCGVCRELVVDYPYYFDRHPCCVPNDKCDGRRYPCNVACPAPDEFDKIPLCTSE